MNVDPKTQIMTLIAPIPEKMAIGVKMKSVTERIVKISSILSRNPELKSDAEVIKGIFRFTEKLESHEIRKFREDFILIMDGDIAKITFPDTVSGREKASIMRRCSADNGRFETKEGKLFLSNEALLNITTEDLWEFIDKNQVKELVVKSDNGQMLEYNEKVLKQLLEKKPTIETLAEMYTLKFEDGEVEVSRAHLLLVGELFETQIDDLDKDIREFNFIERAQSSIRPFLGLLNLVKTGESELDAKVLENADNFFLGEISKCIPEGAWGAEVWAELDIEVTDVPPVPQKILDLKDPENYQIVLIPPEVSMNDFGKIVPDIVHDKKKLNLEWYIWPKIENDYGNNKAGKAYWVAIRTEMDKESRGTATRKEQIDYAKKDRYEGHQAPSLLEVIACNVASYKKTGKSLLGMYKKDCPNFTCCREKIIDGKELPANRRLVVGGSPAVLRVDYYYDYDNVGVAPLLGEF